MMKGPRIAECRTRDTLLGAEHECRLPLGHFGPHRCGVGYHPGGPWYCCHVWGWGA